jgi:hypothetical protein
LHRSPKARQTAGRAFKRTRSLRQCDAGQHEARGILGREQERRAERTIVREHARRTHDPKGPRPSGRYA